MRVRPERFQPTPPDAIFQLPVWRNNASKLHGLSLWENHIPPGTRIPQIYVVNPVNANIYGTRPSTRPCTRVTRPRPSTNVTDILQRCGDMIAQSS